LLTFFLLAFLAPERFAALRAGAFFFFVALLFFFFDFFAMVISC
jgi:hypothetical protein